MAIKMRTIDNGDPLKIKEVSLALGNLTDTSETTAYLYRVPYKCVLVGIQTIVQSAGNSDNTIRIKVKNGSSVLADTGALTLSSAPIANRTVATSAVFSPAPASAIGGLLQNAVGDLLTITDIAAGTSQSANNVTVILELMGV